MAVGWIDKVYNNSRNTWYLKSVDDRHNGALDGGGSRFTLDDAKFHKIAPKTQYAAEWCGIPWYYQSKHFKVLSKDQKSGIAFYTSEIGDGNWIIYEEISTGRKLARQSVPKSSDFHCHLRFEAGSVFIDIVNNNAFSGENAAYMIYSEIKGWVEVLMPAIATMIANKG